MKNVWIDDLQHEDIKILSVKKKTTVTKILNEIICFYFEQNGIEVENTPPISE
jgi:hypothetical protein